MIVHHFDLLRVAVLPYEADPVLIVDPYAVLPTPISSESLEVVARKRPQIVESLRCVELHQLALNDPGNTSKAPRRMTLEQRLGVSVPKGPDHLLRILWAP